MPGIIDVRITEASSLSGLAISTACMVAKAVASAWEMNASEIASS